MRRFSSSWSNTLNKLGFRRVRRRLRKRSRLSERQLAVEFLEPRHLLSITVNTLVDENDGISAGHVSLRDAIAYAATQSGTDTIAFDPSLSGGVIQLTHGVLVVDSDLNVVGPGTNALTIDAQGNSRVFDISWGTNATISGLTVTGGGDVDVGAGISNYGGNLTLDRVRVTDNVTRGLTTAGNDNGGGIYSVYGSLHLINSEVDHNQARWNAGVAFTADDAGDELEISGSTIYSNSARDQGGDGGIGGLGVYSSTEDAFLRVSNSTISSNTAGSTAGIYVGSSAHLVVVNSTITQNEASSTYGGIFLGEANVNLAIYNSIVAGNVDHMWNGLHRDVAKWLGAYDASSSNNLIGVVGWSGLSTTTNLTGTDSAPLDPNLAPLDNYGGLTKTHALRADSPAIDAGNDDDPLDYLGEALVVDQRGLARSVDLGNTGPADGTIGTAHAN